MSQKHIRSDYEIAVHEAAHWLFAEWLHLDRANYVTIEEDETHRGHVNFDRGQEISTLDRCVRQAMMYLAGWAAENFFFWQGGLRALPTCRDKANFERLAERFYPTSRNRQQQFFTACWRESNDAVRSALRTPIEATALLLVSRKILTRPELDDHWETLCLPIPDAGIAIQRVLDEVDVCDDG